MYLEFLTFLGQVLNWEKCFTTKHWSFILEQQESNNTRKIFLTKCVLILRSIIEDWKHSNALMELILPGYCPHSHKVSALCVDVVLKAIQKVRLKQCWTVWDHSAVLIGTLRCFCHHQPAPLMNMKGWLRAPAPCYTASAIHLHTHQNTSAGAWVKDDPIQGITEITFQIRKHFHIDIVNVAAR